MPNTTSFELSKQLYEVAKSKGVGLPVATYFHEPENSHLLDISYPKLEAYTTDELLAWLPENCNVYKTNLKRISGKNKTVFVACYNLADKPWVDAGTPSNALAKLAIYLIENDLLK